MNQALRNHGSQSLLTPGRVRQLGKGSMSQSSQVDLHHEADINRMKERRKFFEGTSRQKVEYDSNLIIKKIERAPKSIPS